MNCLLALLRSDTAALPEDETEWVQMLALAEEEHILPWLIGLCSQRHIANPTVTKRIAALQRESVIAAFYWSTELRGILGVCEQHDLRVVPLKGPFLAERLYGDIGLRSSYDLDLLVSKADLARAEAVLSEMGFKPGTPDDYHRQWFKGATTVELHHDVENPLAFNFQTESALGRIQPASFQGRRCWQLAPSDELLFLCLHGVRHRFDRLSLILDLWLAFQKLPVGGSARDSAKISGPERTELSSLLMLGVAMVRHLRPEITAELRFDAAPERVRHLEALAARLWQRLTTRPSEPLDWNALHAFYLEMELPRDRPRRRWRHLRILLARVVEPDYAFAAQFGMHRDWQVRLLRPLRLITAALRTPLQSGGIDEES